MYQIVNDNMTGNLACIRRLNDMSLIPMAPANTDYQQFKQDVAGGAKIQDENGKNLTAAKTKTFMASLP